MSFVEELVVVSSAAAPPVTTGDTIGLTEVAELPQIVFSSTYDLRRTTDAAFRARGGDRPRDGAHRSPDRGGRGHAAHDHGQCHGVRGQGRSDDAPGRSERVTLIVLARRSSGPER